MKVNNFRAHLQREGLQTFKNISEPNRKTLDDLQVVFRQKYVELESQATAKHK